MILRSLLAVLLLAAAVALGEGLPDLGDVSQATFTPMLERRLGDQIMREIRMDPQYYEDVEATDYINARGGKYLYSHEDFTRRGIQLSFIQPISVTYSQFGNSFVPNLSIIDTMMFNPSDIIQTHILTHYELV